MIEKIVFASGASDSSMDVVRCMQSVKKLGVKEILLLQCYSHGEEASSIGGMVEEIYRENLERQRELLVDQGYKVRTMIVKDSIEDEINEIAQKENADMIVTRATNRSLIGEALFRGLTYQILHNSKKPVMLVRENYKSDPDIKCDMTQHIMFPTDFSQNAAKAFEVLKILAPCRDTKITLVHVQDPTRMDLELLQDLDNLNQEDFSKLMVMKKELEESGAQNVEVDVIQGIPTTEILNLVADEEVSLVLMGTQGMSLVKELYLGSVSHHIARHSSCSVLLV